MLCINKRLYSTGGASSTDRAGRAGGTLRPLCALRTLRAGRTRGTLCSLRARRTGRTLRALQTLHALRPCLLYTSPSPRD